MKIESYKANILYNAVSQRYTGELWVNNRLEQKTGNFLSEGLAVARLNKRIESFNAVNGTNIPPYQKDADTNQFKAVPEVKESLSPKESTPAAELKIVNIDTVHKHQPRKRRKPFTPYGLKLFCRQARQHPPPPRPQSLRTHYRLKPRHVCHVS